MGKDAEPKLYTESDVRLLKDHVARLLAVVEEQAQRIEELELQVARMQRTSDISDISATSPKPPSSDITKPPNLVDPRARHSGGSSCANDVPIEQAGRR